MISINKKSVSETLEQYLMNYRQSFKKRSFNIFYLLILAVISVEEVRSIKFLYDNVIKRFWKKALNSFYYFLSYTNVSLESLMQVTVKIATALITEELKDKATIFLIIDDTLQSKFGDKFDCYAKLFDHTNREGNSYMYGHCFVALLINIPIKHNNTVRYLSLPVGIKLYDKEKSKLQLASDLIDNVMPLLQGQQVILLCDSWYTKGAIIEIIKKHSNLSLIGAVRSDTALYSPIVPPPTGKRGRPRKNGERLDIRSLQYEKVGDYYITTEKVKTRLFKEPVNVTVTTTDVEKFNSIRLYISTISPEDIKAFKHHMAEDIQTPELGKGAYSMRAYRLRWNIEVFFYQQKFFWSFGNYMVRNKEAIEKYINLLAIAYTFVQVIPFIHSAYAKLKFESPQSIKRQISYQLTKELILGTFLQKLKTKKINLEIQEALYETIKLDDVV